MELYLTDENNNDLDLEDVVGDLSEQDIEQFDNDDDGGIDFGE
jgi:hypothetical protein